MKVEISIDKEIKETKVVIIASSRNEEVEQILTQLSKSESDRIIAYNKEGAVMVAHRSIIRIYTALGKVFVVTDSGEYILKQRLYEIEQALPQSTFVRISNTEIINLDRVKVFDLSLSGTIKVIFKDGSFSYVSRRYVSLIKKSLGLKRGGLK